MFAQRCVVTRRKNVAGTWWLSVQRALHTLRRWTRGSESVQMTPYWKPIDGSFQTQKCPVRLFWPRTHIPALSLVSPLIRWFLFLLKSIAPISRRNFLQTAFETLGFQCCRRTNCRPLLLCCLMSSDVGWRISDKLTPMREHGLILLYVHGNHKTR